MTEPSQDLAEVTFEAELVDGDAEREIAKAVGGRQAMARKYVRWVRRRNPDATPAEVIRALERHYVSAVGTAGVIVTAGSIAIDVGIAAIPIAGPATTAAKGVAKATAKETAKTVAKEMAKGAAKAGMRRAAPAGDERLQFELTALFALAVADIHGREYDRDQARTLVYGLTNGRVSQQQIAAMATDLAASTSANTLVVGQKIADGRKDWSHWADTLADSLPGGVAQDLVRTIQTGRLETVREGLDGKQQAAVEYGVGALVGGITRFVFGHEVVSAAREAFSAPPDDFPEHLAVTVKEKPEKDDEPNRALLALESAAQATGDWVGGAATAVGSGVTSAASTVSRPFRSVDLDGDGIPDEPQALTAAKGVLDGAKNLRTGLAGLIKPKQRGRHAAGDKDD